LNFTKVQATFKFRRSLICPVTVTFKEEFFYFFSISNFSELYIMRRGERPPKCATGCTAACPIIRDDIAMAYPGDYIYDG